jgi:trk system potassium uptake protein TrkA
MYIIVAGSGALVYHLANDLRHKHHQLQLIVQDQEQCQNLARRLEMPVICGDPSLPRVLQAAGASEADLVLAVTLNDADNLVISQISKRHFGVPRTVALVANPSHVTMFQRLGIDAVVSVATILTTLVEQQATLEDMISLTPLAEGRIMVTELAIHADSPAAGKTLSELNLSENALIATITRDGEPIIPRGNSRLQAGDRVLLVTKAEEECTAIAQLLGEEAARNL